jgi:hypothetical protein
MAPHDKLSHGIGCPEAKLLLRIRKLECDNGDPRNC